MKVGYRIPFRTVPPSCHFLNNFFAFRDRDFVVREAISELLQHHRVEELDWLYPMLLTRYHQFLFRLAVKTSYPGLKAYKSPYLQVEV